MDKESIIKFLEFFSNKKDRTIVIVDYGNVEKWKHSLKWKVGIKQLAQLTRHFSNKEVFRRFYYGRDCGPNEKCPQITLWSKSVIDTAKINRFEVIDKLVKYIHNPDNTYGYDKKCDQDVDMMIDLIREKDNFDTIVLFSGDGDLMSAIQYLKEQYNKSCYVFGARGHVGREVYDAQAAGFILDVLYAEDFEYRLNSYR
jgi:uncharacterized LabA/DUF88 family protein